MANNEVKLRLSVDGAKAVLSDFDRVRSGMSGVSDAATTTSSAMRALGAAFSVGAVVAWGKAMIDAADAMNDMSQRVGIAVKDLAKYELAASQSGTTMETLARGIKGLAGNLVEHGAALKKAGIDTSNADKAMQQLANVFASMPDGVEKTNLAVKLFGKAGMDMIPMLNLGAEGLQTAAEKTAAYATQMAAMAPLADAFNDNLSVMSLNSKTLGMTMFNEVLPSLVKVTDAMTKADDQGNSLASVFGKGLRTAFETVALIASDVIFVFQGVGREIGGIAAQVVAAATGNWSGFSAISDAMKEDAKKARIELDRFQENLVSRGEKVQTVYNKRQGFGEQVKSGTSGSTLLAALGADKAGTEAAKAANALLKERIELAKWNTKAVDELFDAQEKVRLQTEDQIKTARTTLEQIEFETRLLEMNTEQRAQATLERDLEREGIVKGTLAYDAYIVKLREAMAIKTGREDSIKAADDMREAQKKAAEESAKYWEDALMRAFESGKGFFQSLWDTIKNTLKTQVLKVLVSATGLTGMSAAGAGDLAGGGGNLLGTAANLGKMYDTITGGFTKLTATVSGNLQYAADWMMTSQSDLVASLGESLSANVGTLSSVAGYAAGAAAGLAIGKAISGGYGSNTAVNAGTVIGSVLGGPIGGAIGGAIGGLVNRAFGRGPTQLTSSGTRGTFSGDSFSGQNYANYKKDGGWFRSDKNWTDISAMDSATADAWSTAFAGVKGSVAGMAESLGLATDKITSYSKYIDVAAGTTQEALTAIFTGMADEMATAAAPAIAEFAKSGETASVTLQRLSGSLTTANAWLSMLRNRLFNVSLSGADAASALADAFGGLDNLAASSKTYYDAFYSEAERTAISTENLAKAMALVGIAIPNSKQAFRDVVSGLDLTTDAGRNAYAVMLMLAPEFDAAAQAADRMAQATATAIIKTFTGNRQLLPALNAASLAIGDVADGAGSMTTGLSYINKVMGDSQSGVITLGGAIGTLGTGMTQSQKSASLLTAQIADLEDNADRARINFAGLGVALANVDTATFVATVALMFENLADRIGNVLDGISAERIAVREAALQIINPTVMSKEQIARGIAGINTGLPSNVGVVAANSALAAADYSKNVASNTVAGMIAVAEARQQSILSGLNGLAPSTMTPGQTSDAAWENIIGSAWQAHVARFGIGWNTSRTTDAERAGQLSAMQSTYTSQKNAEVTAYAQTVAASDNAAIAAAATSISAATQVQVLAADAAKTAALDYARALQTFAIDAGKSVTKLGRLREETVKYYEAQKALAELMGNSAAGLRKSVADYRYSQLSPEQQLASLQSQFSSAYSMALASQGDGATLAGYGDKLNSLLGPLIDKLGETGGSNLVSNYLAQAESIASLIESNIPVNYQQDSLNLLGSIDATLAALEASSLSAEAIISNAVAAGADRTATGLRTIGEAISGKSIPAFALGGSFGGGVRLVGENGPELEVTGPSRIFSADQTRSMLGGNTARLEALVERLTQKVEDLNAAAQATAGYTNKTAKLLDRAMPDGDALATRVAA